MNEEATLLVVTTGKDDDGFPVETTKEYPIWVREKSATRSEFYAAMQEGITITTVLETRQEDYEQTAYMVNNKKVYATQIEHDGSTYDIVRTYRTDKAMIELMCN